MPFQLKQTNKKNQTEKNPNRSKTKEEKRKNYSHRQGKKDTFFVHILE